MIPRKPLARQNKQAGDKDSRILLGPALTLAALAVLAASFSWARRWLISGAAIESFLVVYGAETGNRIFPDIPLWTFLATFNLIYAICSTSWLLHAMFATFCYLAALFTSIAQFKFAANMARRVLRKLLGQHPHFVRDKLALFNLPALEIDTDVDGLFVIRGVTISLLNLSLVAHGIELGRSHLTKSNVACSLFRRSQAGRRHRACNLCR